MGEYGGICPRYANSTRVESNWYRRLRLAQGSHTEICLRDGRFHRRRRRWVNVDIHRPGAIERQPSLGVGAQDRPGVNDNHFRPIGDLAGGTDGVLELVAAHQCTVRKTRMRSLSVSRPPIAATSRISMQSRLSPVRKRWSPGTSRWSSKDFQRSRFRRWGSPATPVRNRCKLRSIVGCRCVRVERLRCLTNSRCSLQERRSESAGRHLGRPSPSPWPRWIDSACRT